jgi:hypothetical protein
MITRLLNFIARAKSRVETSSSGSHAAEASNDTDGGSALFISSCRRDKNSR